MSRLGEVEVAPSRRPRAECVDDDRELRADVCLRLGSGGDADGEQRVLGVDGGERPVLRARPRELAAEVPQLERDERRARRGAGRRDELLDRLRRQRPEQQSLAAGGDRMLRVHVHAGELGCRARPDRVHDGAERAERGEQLVGDLRLAEVYGLDHDERLTSQRLRDVGDRREPEVAGDRRQLVGRLVAGELRPGVEDLALALDRPPEDAGVDLGDGHEPELQRRHDAEVAAAAAEGPEEIGLVVAVGADEATVGGDELDRVDARRRQAVPAAEEAQATADRVADDADVGRRAGERGETVLGGRLDELDRPDACLDPRDPALRVDLDPPHALGLQEDGVGE